MEPKGVMHLEKDLCFDFDRQVLFVTRPARAEKQLSEQRYNVMRYLALHAGRVCMREDIFERCWDEDKKEKIEDDRAAVRKVILFLRQCIRDLAPDVQADNLIEMRKGVGYCLNVEKAKAGAAAYTMLSDDDPYRNEYYAASMMDCNGDYEGAYAVRKRLADCGHAPSMNAVGVALVKGEGVAQDKERGLEYYREAARLGYPAAQLNLGDHYMDAMGTEFAPEKAVEMYLLAAQNPISPDPDAMYRLYMCYKAGRGVMANAEKAEYWRARAAALGRTEHVDYYTNTRNR